jgi:translation initiation factor IF-3
MFRGREMAHRKVGFAKLDRVKEMLGELVTVENPPQMNGRFLSMVLVPNREAVEAARTEMEEAEKKEREAEATEAPAGEA